MKRPLFLLLLLFSFDAARPLAAQENKELLARQYFGEQDYDKAAELYEKLAGSDPASLYLYDQYLQCLMALNYVIHLSSIHISGSLLHMMPVHLYIATLRSRASRIHNMLPILMRCIMDRGALQIMQFN